jgi:outer membrane protein assembly factor BamB
MKLKKIAVLITAAFICGAYTTMGQNPGQLKWRGTPFVIGGGVGGSPASTSDGSKIFITADDGFLYGIDPTTGQALAGFTTPNLHNIPGYGGEGGLELIASPLIAPNGTIYVMSTDGHLYGVNQTGAIISTLQVGFGGAGCGLARGPNGMIYITEDDDVNVYAVDTTANNGQGAVVWSLDVPPAIGRGQFIDCAPTVGADGTIFFYISDPPSIANSHSTLVAVTDEGCRGAVKWTADLGLLKEEDNDFHTTLALDNAGRIYAPYGAGSIGLIALNITNGQAVPNFWPFITPTRASIQSSPTIGTNGTIFFGANDGVFYALNPDATLKWSFDTTTHIPISSTAAYGVDGSLYFGQGGRLWSIEETTNNGAYLKWIYPSLWSQPAFNGAIRSSPLMVGADNSIYFGCDDGNVYTVIGNAPLANSQWPMYRKDINHSASTAPATITLPPYTVAVSLQGPADIWKGQTGFGVPPSGGLTWFTLTRSSCSGSLNTTLQVAFLLGGDGTALSTPTQNYDPAFAYSGLDFTASSCTQAPFPNGFYVTFNPGDAQKTVYAQTLDTATSADVQTLLLTIPPGQAGFAPEAGASTATATIHPDPNLNNPNN